MASHAPRGVRIESARAALASAGAEWLVAAASPDFRWLTGAPARVSERLVALALPREGAPFVVAPRLEAEALARDCNGLEMVVWEEHEDPLARLVARAGIRRGQRLLLADGLRVSHVLRLSALATCEPAAPVLAPLRAAKSEQEVALLAEAGRHADRVVEAAAEFARPGMPEREIARFIADRFESMGDAAPWSIVASGPNSAVPHHATGDRRLAEDEVLVLDLGATTGGYCSDVTRTYYFGDPPRQVLRAYEVVNQARAVGVGAARAGVPCEDVDAAARDVVARAGLGEYFTHRTGHGVGLEVHEPPYLVRGERTPLACGNVHSVEPGVYFPGRFGIRLEDIVAVGTDGARRLNEAPLDLRPPNRR